MTDAGYIIQIAARYNTICNYIFQVSPGNNVKIQSKNFKKKKKREKEKRRGCWKCDSGRYSYNYVDRSSCFCTHYHAPDLRAPSRSTGLIPPLMWSPFSNVLCPLLPPFPPCLGVGPFLLSNPNSMSRPPDSLGRTWWFCLGFWLRWRRVKSRPRKQAIAETTMITARTMKTDPNDPFEW